MVSFQRLVSQNRAAILHSHQGPAPFPLNSSISFGLRSISRLGFVYNTTENPVFSVDIYDRLLLQKMVVPGCKCHAYLASPNHERYEQHADDKSNDPYHNEHVADTHASNPGVDGKWYTNTYGIAEESNANEGFGGELGGD